MSYEIPSPLSFSPCLSALHSRGPRVFTRTTTPTGSRIILIMSPLLSPPSGIQFHQNLWAPLMLRGLLGILLGLILFMMGRTTLPAVVFLFGIYAFLDGCFNMTIAWMEEVHQKCCWTFTILGLLGIGIGAVSVGWPGITALRLDYVVSAWALVTSFLTAAALHLWLDLKRGWLLVLSWPLFIALHLTFAPRLPMSSLGVKWYLGAYAMGLGFLLLWSSSKIYLTHSLYRPWHNGFPTSPSILSPLYVHAKVDQGSCQYQHRNTFFIIER